MATFSENLQKVYIFAGQAALLGALWVCVTQALEWYARKQQIAKAKAAQPSPARGGGTGQPGGTADGAAATESSPPIDEVGSLAVCALVPPGTFTFGG